MKKALIMLLLLVVTATAERTLWRDEQACTPMIPKEDRSEIWFLKACSDPDKAFQQWLKDNYPNWNIYQFDPEWTKDWVIFRKH